MRKFGKFIGIVALVILGGLSIIYFSTSGARDLGRKFVTLASDGDVAAAHELFHSSLQKELSLDKLSAAMHGVKPYTEVSFGSVSTGTGEATEIKGTATTADGCESLVEFKVLNDKIIAFNIEPLCR